MHAMCLVRHLPVDTTAKETSYAKRTLYGFTILALVALQSLLRVLGHQQWFLQSIHDLQRQDHPYKCFGYFSPVALQGSLEYLEEHADLLGGWRSCDSKSVAVM